VAVPPDRDLHPVREFRTFTTELHPTGRLACAMRGEDGGDGIDGRILDSPL
jgi:hypothetical protein